MPRLQVQKSSFLNLSPGIFLFQKFLITPFYLLVTTSLITVPIFNHATPAQAQNNSSLVQRGNRLLKRGWVNDAIKVFQQAIKRNPKSIKANFGLATAYNRAGNIDKAWNFYQRVCELGLHVEVPRYIGHANVVNDEQGKSTNAHPVRIVSSHNCIHLMREQLTA